MRIIINIIYSAYTQPYLLLRVVVQVRYFVTEFIIGNLPLFASLKEVFISCIRNELGDVYKVVDPTLSVVDDWLVGSISPFIINYIRRQKVNHSTRRENLQKMLPSNALQGTQTQTLTPLSHRAATVKHGIRIPALFAVTSSEHSSLLLQ